LWSLRAERERQATQEREAARQNPGTTPGNALVLASVVETENDLNMDHLYGYEPGTHAKWKAETAARRAAAEAEADALLKRLETDPEFRAAHEAEKARQEEERAKRDAEWQKREERNAKRRKGDGYRYRQETPREARRSLRSFSEGRAKGDDIGLDPQVGRGGSAPRLR
jgi:hypothetical protein